MVLSHFGKFYGGVLIFFRGGRMGILCDYTISNLQFSIVSNGQNTVCFRFPQLLGSIDHRTGLFNHPIWCGLKSVGTAAFGTRGDWLHFGIHDRFSSSIQLIACQNLKTAHIKYNNTDLFLPLDHRMQWNFCFLGQTEWELVVGQHFVKEFVKPLTL